MLRVAVALIAVAFAALAGCGGGQKYHYSDETITAFLTSCVNAEIPANLSRDQAVEGCSCTLKKIEAHVSPEDFIAASSRLENDPNADPPAAWGRWAYQCGQEIAKKKR